MISALVHLAAFTFLRSESFDLSARGASRSGPARAPAGSRAVFAGLRALEVIEVTEEVEPVEIAPVPVPPRPPLDVERALEGFRAGTAALGVPEDLPAAGAGGSAGADTPPSLYSFRWPEYPADAPRADGPQVVVVEVRVGRDGTVLSARLVRPSQIEVLNTKALEMARGARFRPARRAGRSVEAPFTLEFPFTP